MKELLFAFNDHHAKYLIVGAYAVSFHAQPRTTKDLDILIGNNPENARAAFDALTHFGAPLEGLTPDDLITAGSYYRMGREPITADILLEIDGIDFDAA